MVTSASTACSSSDVDWWQSSPLCNHVTQNKCCWCWSALIVGMTLRWCPELSHR